MDKTERTECPICKNAISPDQRWCHECGCDLKISDNVIKNQVTFENVDSKVWKYFSVYEISRRLKLADKKNKRYSQINRTCEDAILSWFGVTREGLYASYCLDVEGNNTGRIVLYKGTKNEKVVQVYLSTKQAFHLFLNHINATRSNDADAVYRAFLHWIVQWMGMRYNKKSGISSLKPYSLDEYIFRFFILLEQMFEKTMIVVSQSGRFYKRSLFKSLTSGEQKMLLEDKNSAETQLDELYDELFKQSNIFPEDFLVKKSVLRCTHSGHHLKNVKGTIDVLDKEGKVAIINFTGGYCEKCNRYYIMDSVFDSIRQYGVLMCRVIDERKEPNNTNAADNALNLANQSILREYGYSVSQGANLTQEQRRSLLVSIIDRGILTQGEVLSYLNFYIRFRGNDDKMSMAIKKWNGDRKYITDYIFKKGEKRKVHSIRIK